MVFIDTHFHYVHKSLATSLCDVRQKLAMNDKIVAHFLILLRYIQIIALPHWSYMWNMRKTLIITFIHVRFHERGKKKKQKTKTHGCLVLCLSRCELLTIKLLTLTDVSVVLSDHHWGELQDLLSQWGIQVVCGEPLHFSSLQAGGRVHLRLRHQPVVHWHRQSVGGSHAPPLPRRVQTWLLHHQLLPGLHHRLPVSGPREQSAGSQVSTWLAIQMFQRN